MTRTITAAFRTTLESSSASDLAIVFATLTHPSLETPLYFNSDIEDYTFGGVTYLGFAFTISLLTDDDQPPQGQISIANVDQWLGEAIQLLSTAPQLTLSVYARSDFDSSTPRVPVGTPSLQYSATGLFLRGITVDAMTVSATLSTYDIASEPWPAIRSTVNRLPGLYARAPVTG